jgi:DNA invertase Pin-like site-specific DNA recombinase
MTEKDASLGSPERVALCLRVSSEEQRERETIEIQNEFLGQYCSLYGLDVAGIYKDDGVSGTIPPQERPEGRRLLEDAQAGRFDAVLVCKLDRLGRSLLVIVDAHDRLQAAGVALKSATEPIDTSTPSGRLIFQMLASFAEYERGTIRERTQAGLHRALRNGKFTGRLPYGYKLSPEETGLILVEEEARIVREVIANIAAGATLYSESKRLNDEGVPSPAIVSGATIGGGVRDRGPARPSGISSTRRHTPAFTGSASRAEAAKRRSSSVRSPPWSSRGSENAHRRNWSRTRAAPGNFARMGENISSRGLSGAACVVTLVTEAQARAGSRGALRNIHTTVVPRTEPIRAWALPPTALLASPPTGSKILYGPTCGRSLRTPERSWNASAPRALIPTPLIMNLRPGAMT